jgi:hypothetical protein
LLRGNPKQNKGKEKLSCCPFYKILIESDDTRRSNALFEMRSERMMRSLPWLSVLLLLSLVYSTHAETASSSAAAIAGNSRPQHVDRDNSKRTVFGWRGGGSSPHQGTTNTRTTATTEANHNATVEAYVAAMKEKDSQATDEHVDDDKGEEPEDGTAGNDGSSSAGTASAADEENPAVVGVKSHNQQSHHKKSNAVGDPDGDDDDDDSDESLSDFSEEWEENEEFEEFVDDLMVEPQLQVEVELVEEGSENSNNNNDEADDEMMMVFDDDPDNGKPSGGGGVGVRLGRMNKSRRGNNNNRRNSWRSKSSSASSSRLSNDQSRLLEAWVPHVYFPPTPSALAYLTEHARLLDATSKNRLDRRTLYAGLLIEWGAADTKLSTASRKFLAPGASQTLQAALSMATQPQWRQSAPRTSGIRLYQDEEAAIKSTTLSMQETIAMALVSQNEKLI